MLYNYSCTFNEADEIVSLVADEIKQQREDKEYDTTSDFVNDIKTRSVDNEIITPLNHVEPYC